MDSQSIQFEVTDRLTGIGRFFGLLHGLLEFLFQEFGRMLLRFDRLAENRVSPAILLLHGARSFLHVLKHSRLDGSGVRNDGLG